MNDKITESKNPKSSSLDKMSITEIVELINEEDSKISRVIKEIIPQIKQSSIGDCCYRDNIRSDEGRVFPKGTYSFYFSTSSFCI